MIESTKACVLGLQCYMDCADSLPNLELSVFVLHVCVLIQTEWHFKQDNSGRLAIGVIGCGCLKECTGTFSCLLTD